MCVRSRARTGWKAWAAAKLPRGTLFHHYKIDDQGLIRWANLIIATGHNMAMNRGILQVAEHFLHGERLAPGLLNRVEALIRTYDPCLSSSTQAFGEMPLVAQLFNSAGEMLDEARKAC
jgi:NAD-reducing hydrogenase large subunit